MSRPYVIVQITSSKVQSGGTRQALLLSRELADRGHRILFCAPARSSSLAHAESLGLETRPFDFGNLLGQWRASRVLRSLVREVGGDLVHAHHTKAHNVGLLATFGGPFSPVIANRGVLFAPEFPLKFRSWRTSAVITNSGRVKQVLERSGVPGGKIHVVYNGKELPALEALEARRSSLRAELSLDGSGPVVGTVGSGRPEKGFQFLVEAAPAILEAFPEATFVLVGAGTERLEQRIGELGLGKRFRLTGHRSDAVELMGLFDVFVLPSIDMDSCPNVLLEAMGVGLPVIGTDVGGVAEILEGGEVGTVVPAREPASIAQAVRDALSDRGRSRDRGLRARTRVAERFSVAEKTDRTLDVYRAVLGREHR